jgi:hypothetical protein
VFVVLRLGPPSNGAASFREPDISLASGGKVIVAGNDYLQIRFGRFLNRTMN